MDFRVPERKPGPKERAEARARKQADEKARDERQELADRALGGEIESIEFCNQDASRYRSVRITLDDPCITLEISSCCCLFFEELEEA